MNSPVPFDEVSRLQALKRYALLETPADPLFDEVVSLAAALCHTPIAQVGFMSRDRLWIKAAVGLPIRRVPRRTSMSAYAICKQGEMLVIPDTRLDWRFARSSLLVRNPPVRFFAAMPLVEPTGYAIGTLMVMDYLPRCLSGAEQVVLQSLAQTAMALLESRQLAQRLEIEESGRHQILKLAPM